MSNLSMPPNLALVFTHLTAVRELDRYLHEKGAEKDLDRYIKEVVSPGLQERVPILKDWHCEVRKEELACYPSDWKLAGDTRVWISLYLPSPISSVDDEPSVNLMAPPDWNGYASFNDLRTPWVKSLKDEGFGLKKEHADWVEDSALAKYVQWRSASGSFDEADFLDRIFAETGRIVSLETQITETIRTASFTSASSPRNKKSRK
jgi:hypothetical protein